MTSNVETAPPAKKRAASSLAYPMWSPRSASSSAASSRTLYQAGRDTIDMVLKNVLPFMAFVAVPDRHDHQHRRRRLDRRRLTSPGQQPHRPAADLSFFCSIPILSPLLGPARSSPRSSAS